MERRISFSAVDNGVSTTLDRLRRSSTDLNRDMIEQARQYSQSGRQQVEFIEQQIRAIERRNRIEREGQELSAKEQFASDKNRGQFQKTMGSISASSDQDDMQIKLLRELVETIKLTSKEEISEDKRGVQQRIQEQKRGFLSSMLFGKQALSPEDQLKLSLQEEELKGGPSGKGGGRGVMGDVFAGTLLANMLTQFQRGLSTLPGAQNEEQVIGGLLSSLSAIPIFGAGFGLAGAAYSRTTQERLQDQVSRARMRGMTGGNASFGFSQYGFDAASSNQLAMQAMSAAGTSNFNVGNSVALQRAYSLDPGLLNETTRISRQTQGGPNSLLGEINKLIQSAGLKEDRTFLAELLRNQNQLVQQFGQSAEVVNRGIATNAIMMFNNVGGSFSMKDPRSMQRIGQINNALSNPQNDIMRAENFSVLRGMNPNAGIFDIMQMQEQGIQTPGLLQGVMGNISNRFGGNQQMAMMALQQRLGLGFSATRQLYQNRGAIMSGEMNQQDIDNLISEAETKKLGQINTADLEKSSAIISNAFVEGATEGMLKVAELTGERIAEKVRKLLNANNRENPSVSK